MLFVSVALLSHTNSSVSFPEVPIYKVLLCLTHKMTFSGWAVAFLHQMLCRVSFKKKYWKPCNAQKFPFVAGSVFKLFLFLPHVAHETSEKIVGALESSAALVPVSSASGCSRGGRWFACGVYNILSGCILCTLRRMCFGVRYEEARHGDEHTSSDCPSAARSNIYHRLFFKRGWDMNMTWLFFSFAFVSQVIQISEFGLCFEAELPWELPIFWKELRSQYCPSFGGGTNEVSSLPLIT